MTGMFKPANGGRRRRASMDLATRIAALCLILSSPCLAAPPGDATARVEKLADGVYVILHDDATEAWPHGNTGVVIGENGVLVVDSCYLPSRARGDIALIRKLTDRPVRWLVYTHWHFDHNNGGIAYRDAFPGVSIVSERETARFIEINGIWWSRMQSVPGSSHLQEIQKLEQQLSQGRDEKGASLTAETRRGLEKHLQQRRNEAAELASLKIVTPDLLFDHELALTVGRRRVELRDRGRGNSPHDVTIYLPEDRVLFTGDLVVQSPVPYTGNSWPVTWVGVLDEVESIPVRALVPGHGPVMRDHTYTRQVRTLLEASNTRVEAKIREGKTLEQIQDEVTLDDVRRAVPPWNGPDLDEDWRKTVRNLVERSWRGVRGQG